MAAEHKEVKFYELVWRTPARNGVIHLTLADDTIESITIGEIEELHALGTILRNEKTIFLNTGTKDLATGREPVGGQESG